jgi:chromosomal replication initiation ATPase DnaA
VQVSAGNPDEAARLAATLPDLDDRLDIEALRIWAQRQGLTLEQLDPAAGQTGRQVAARRIAAGFLRRRGWSYPRIARALGYQDHTSVMHLLRTAR